MKRSVVILAVVFSLSVMQLYSQNQVGKDHEKDVKEAVEEAKKKAIDEAKANKDVKDGQEFGRSYNNFFDFNGPNGFYSPENDEAKRAAAKAHVDSARRAWEEAIIKGTDSFPDYMEEFAEPYRRAFEKANKEYTEEWSKNKQSFSPNNYGGVPFMTTVKHTDWFISRSLVDDSFTAVYQFEVVEDTKNVSIAITGNGWKGTINIRAYAPNGLFIDLAIDEFGNLNWRKNYAITETQYQEKIGVWKFEIKASEATGFFKISAQTY